MEGRRRAFETQLSRDVSIAWHVEAFARTKRLEPLEKVLRKVKRALAGHEPLANQTPEDMLNVLRGFQAAGAEMSFRFIPHGSEGES